MSEKPTNNFKIAYSDEVGSSTDSIEFVKQSQTGPGAESGQLIHTMPSAFRFGPKNQTNSRVGLLIIVAGLILFAFLAYVVFLAINKQSIFSFNPTSKPVTDLVDDSVVVNQSEEPEFIDDLVDEVVIDWSDPEEVYLQLRLNLDQALTLEDFYSVFIAGASQEKAYQLNEQIIGLESLSSSQKSNTLSISRAILIPLTPADQIIKKIDGDRATLVIVKADSGRLAQVEMLLEEGHWRFNSETWQDELVDDQDSESGDDDTKDDQDDYQFSLIDQLSLDADSDQDGLSDKEELLLGTDPDNPDSDSDGYNDLAEIQSGYDPAGPGFLSDNSGLKTVSHQQWSMLVPTTWEHQLGNDGSAIFRSNDGHFIQLIVVNKEIGQGLLGWYQEMFKVLDDQVPEIVAINGRSGVFSPDQLTYYTTRSADDYLVSITYNPEANYLLSYFNIFHLAVNSLSFSD